MFREVVHTEPLLLYSGNWFISVSFCLTCCLTLLSFNGVMINLLSELRIVKGTLSSSVSVIWLRLPGCSTRI